MKSRHYRAPRWRFRELLQTMGPYTKIATLLEERGYPPLPENTITAWAHRNSIPPSWLPAVLSLALESRTIGSIDDLKGNDHERLAESNSQP